MAVGGGLITGGSGTEAERGNRMVGECRTVDLSWSERPLVTTHLAVTRS
jgi:hypothetical protein